MINKIESWREEVGCEMSDQRLSERHIKLVEALARNPEASFTTSFDTQAEVTAAYRFVSNDKARMETLLKGHVSSSLGRAEVLGEAIAIHDTTDLTYPLHEHIRFGLQPFSNARQGCFLHMTLLMSADGVRCPIGCINVHPYVHLKKLDNPDARQFWLERYEPMDSEQERWWRGVEKAEAIAEGRVSLIHVMDREGDDYQLLANLVLNDKRFVIRLSQPRLVETEDDQPLETLFERLNVQSFTGKREVTLSARIDKGRQQHNIKAFPARRQRVATLSVRAATMKIRRPKNRSDLKHLPKLLTLHVVEVLEVDCPPGDEPVHWVLATLEPIETESDLWRVVDLYRARWLIEEFNKALKTGCQYEERQLDSASTLLAALGLFIPIACNLLMMRHLDREASDLPASVALSPSMLAVLVALLPKWNWPSEIKVGDAYRAIARLGGHLKHNGPPGWLTLSRGFRKLLDAHRGWLLAMGMVKHEM